MTTPVPSIESEQQAERMGKFLRRWVLPQHHDAAFGDLLEIAKATGEYVADEATVIAGGRLDSLAILIMVYEATVYCMLPFFKRSTMPEIAKMIESQISCCADAHAKTIGEPAMFADQVPPYVDKTKPDGTIDASKGG